MRAEATYDWDDPVTRFLLISIVAFAVIASLLLIVTVISRWRRIGAEKRKQVLARDVEDIVSAYLFAEQPDPQQVAGKYAVNTLFARLLLKTVILLHGQYSGEYARRLEEFYRVSGLQEVTRKKLRSRKWNERLEAVRDLAEMNVEELADAIAPLCYDRRPLMRMEAIIAIVRLKGIAALHILGDYPYQLTDWTQVHILEVLKTQGSADVPDIGFLLAARENSVRLLGVRLVGFYGLLVHADRLRELLEETADSQTAAAIRDVLEKLGPMAYNNQFSEK